MDILFIWLYPWIILLMMLEWVILLSLIIWPFIQLYTLKSLDLLRRLSPLESKRVSMSLLFDVILKVLFYFNIRKIFTRLWITVMKSYDHYWTSMLRWKNELLLSDHLSPGIQWSYHRKAEMSTTWTQMASIWTSIWSCVIYAPM